MREISGPSHQAQGSPPIGHNRATDRNQSKAMDHSPRPRRCPPLPKKFRQAPRLPAVVAGSATAPGELLLINPFYPKDPWGSFGKHVLTPSLALTSIGGATPREWRVRVWDENLLQGLPPVDPVPEVVGITVHITFASRAYELARWYRLHGSFVILGGPHVTACPGEAELHADAVVVGDGVSVWPHVLHDVRHGNLKRRYQGSYRTPDYQSSPPPRRELLDRNCFLTTSSVIATRGCHNRCDFCFLAVDGLDMPYQTRDVHQVIDDILVERQPYTVFIDNNLGSNRHFLRRLCAALRPLGIIWSAATSLDVTDNPTLVREMALSGCTGVFVGFESLTNANLADSGKRTPPPSDYARRVFLLQDNGIQVNGSFVLGFDHDRPDVFERLVAWIEDVRLECATYQILTPYPGTPLYARLEAAGRLLHSNWDLYDTAHCVFRPRHMSCEELEAGYSWCYERTFSPLSVWRRRPRQLSAVPPYLAMTALYKWSNRLWPLLIRRRLVGPAWRPLVRLSRLRHLRHRRRLATALPSAILELSP